MVTKELFNFLNQLEKNNNREWFTENKPTFQKHQAEIKDLFQDVQTKLSATDNIEGHKIYRIYRDVRFSKDKLPYKKHFSGYFSRATKQLRGGYYLHIEHNNTVVGGGFYAPNSEDLKRIRQEFEYGDSEMRTIIDSKEFKDTFGELVGDEVKSAPRGFDKNDPAIDLIRKKQFIAMRKFTDEEVLSPHFIEDVVKTFEALRPFFDYMSSILTTDLNGEPIK
ncbi:DUF2461 domain-containing protein [Flammeovirga kamogawensis]|uniref:DUF2461 domain-containing protein n=1 Tax=Flammeovirga kamogawensis TaxID=373891 RepID=A0ABX8GXL3_9BACT|nr:DUF2461 domain-containing protein [Flammeovirga kamogawensis]MBB6462865.1 uncharacterized protein (TIGR02453 family) [Flammeovirga kamogawensis]QWG08353.1 DUF2461 domain-containing protein [Flammeovirga kamogawensis]TRX66650.1 DUF2461 domain-containing protein [Flammeovirga kamogawensis]